MSHNQNVRKASSLIKLDFCSFWVIPGHKKTLRVDKFCDKQDPIDKEGYETHKTYNDASRGTLEF